MVRSQENSPSLWCDLLPRPVAKDHKYTRGHAVVYGGPIESTGAARLACAGAYACLRMGAGLVSVACDSRSLPLYAHHLTAVMTKPVDNIDAFESLIADDHVTAVLIGPGAGKTSHTRSSVAACLRHNKTCVLDADALTLWDDAHELFEMIQESDANVILMPHSGEFSGLFGVLSDNERVATTINAAKRSGAVVIHKGAETVIASAIGACVVNRHASPQLATAGSGDVLAGLVAGLLAQHMPPFDAACAATWIHGEAALRFGKPGLIAEDIPALIPGILEDLVAYQ